MKWKYIHSCPKHILSIGDISDMYIALFHYNSILGPSRTPSYPMESCNQSQESSKNCTGHELNRNHDELDSSQSRQVRELCSGQEPHKAPTFKEMGSNMLKKKAKAILEEYLSIQDLDEAITCVQEIESPFTFHMFVYTCFAEVIERSTIHRHMIGGLLYELVAHKVLSLSMYYKGWVAPNSGLTHLPLDKMAAISLTIFSNALSWMKSFKCWFQDHCSLFLRVQLTINQHWIR